MAIRPQCAWIAMTYTADSPYATNGGTVDKLFHPTEPVLIEPSLERLDDSDLIKGHEFPVDTNLDIIIAQNISIPFSFPGSVSLIGLLSVMALGVVAETGSGDFVHTIKSMVACTGDQLPSAQWVLGLTGDTASYLTVKGVCINELRISMQDQGRLIVSGTAITDGTLTDNASFSVPSATSTDYILGSQADFLTADTGSSLVSDKTNLRGFEFSINNNLDVADGRGNYASAGKFLKSLRFGARDYSITITVEAHQGGTYWDDFIAGTMKDVQVTVTKSSTRLIDLQFKSCKIYELRSRFDGIRDVLEITYKPFYTAGDSSPLIFIVKSGDAEYMIGI